MSGPDQLSALDQAAAVLAGRLAIRVHSIRAAAWITRSALEQTIDGLLQRKGLPTGRANTRSLLGCLEVLYQDDAAWVATSAQYAWDRLSRAAHHHAYELPPTHAEVAVLVEVVRRLDGYCTSSTPDSRAGSAAQSSPPGPVAH
ncbi:hypothetical protein [Skermania piniformis]|uniref:DUF4145 domain-containing protein n=1 Tax=Skermania pinensis TaxID=39122 RepID=A0ABX8SCN0_9ACTN|nr:hypothetical protein [Skermania piniformis]QXQ15553.1 hypothetical protein KV203_09825 [Skermania piniformis]